jgi:apolipoprotein N-acyltransferase
MDATPGEDFTSAFDTPLFSIPSADIGGILTIVFILVFLAWLLYTAVVSYHWFRYSHRSWLAIPALALHVFISGSLILYIASGLS